jgi:RimJ/RimL family protein N-acetyltransferase
LGKIAEEIKGTEMKYFKKLIGKKCYLSPINVENAEKYTEWLNDLEVSKYLSHSRRQITVSKEREILEELSKKGAQVFGIIDLRTDELIGNCGLFNIDYANQRGEFGIFIGNKSYWGKGYGTEASILLLDYGFNILNLHSIMLEVFSFNTRAIRCYESIGFRIIGKRRESKIICGEKYDIIYMDILADEFTKGNLRESLL